MIILFLGSSKEEHLTVNQVVAGSSPARGEFNYKNKDVTGGIREISKIP